MSAIKYFHASPTGKGSMLSVELVPGNHERSGGLRFRLCPQASGPIEVGKLPEKWFDQENGISFFMGIGDLGQLSGVLCGWAENIADGKGLYHRSEYMSTKVYFEHVVDPLPRYRLCVVQRPNGDGADRECSIALRPDEGWVLLQALEASMGKIAFGE